MHSFHDYERVSGQKINALKSAITFGDKVSEDIKDWIKTRIGISLEGGTGKYLGLPECLSGSKQNILGYIKDNCKKKLTGWYAKNLSQGGKEVLLKSVAMAMPVYAMSYFKLPMEICKNLTSAMMDFWWNSEENKRKIQWIGWEKLTMPKKLGGIGFRDLKVFNQALLAKQAWHFLHDPTSLFSRFFKSRYFVYGDFIEAPNGKRSSYAWRSMIYGGELLEKGLKRSIGNGKNTFVWIDHWLYDHSATRPGGRQSLMNINLKVSDLIDADTHKWKAQVLSELFTDEDLRLIMKHAYRSKTWQIPLFGLIL